ncbi:MAG: DUF1800 family protein [Parvularcula sp.]|jgi:uncharacterized protein (DUF1800 family)|nr:DUF1800 family protein [Parvularcula sp.]
MKSAHWLAAVAAALMLSACFGGGGGEKTTNGQAEVPPQTPAPAPAPSNPTNTPDPSPEKPAPFPSPTGKAPTPPDLSSIDPLAPLETAPNYDVFRFAQQATFGANPRDLAEIETMGYANWIEWQISLPISSYVERAKTHYAATSGFGRHHLLVMAWERALYGDDQLRQRMTFALSQIVVASALHGSDRPYQRSMAAYADVLQRNALGNYGDLIREVTFTPAMGQYLTHIDNEKADPLRGSKPDENYAREIMQLFTIGLHQLESDGSPRNEETYDSTDVEGLAAVMTGLSWPSGWGKRPHADDDEVFATLKGYSEKHEGAPKSFLNTVVNVGTSAEDSIELALDHLLNHPNLAPFISEQLIQRLVTSNPSRAYVKRVADVFNAGRYVLPNDRAIGTGRRGDLAATAAAILLDREARDQLPSEETGKLREPVLRLAQLHRTFRPDIDVSSSGSLPKTEGWTTRIHFSNYLGQNFFTSPSVFNFYRPGYVPAGTESGTLGLRVPEMQIATASAQVSYVNIMAGIVSRPDQSADGSRVGEIDLSHYLAAADDPTKLVRQVSYLLIGRPLDPVRERQVIDAVENVGGLKINSTVRRRRVEIAFLMMLTSPDYIVQG